jgi:GT2 family glycosyltransferase
MDQKTPQISVIIPHYRDLANLELCLSALERQTVPLERFEIIVGDNNSPEGEAALERVIAGRAKMVVVTERGAGPARNGAASLARGEILAFTDSDCRPDSRWLETGLEALQAFDFVGGAVRVVVDDERHMTPVEAFERVFAFRNEFYVTRKNFTVTANLLCPRALFESVGGFISGKIVEDQEWCRRAASMGYRIGYAPASIVSHPARRTWDEMLKKLQRVNIENYNLMTMSKRTGRLEWLLRTLMLPASAIFHTPRTLLSPELNDFRQRVGALSVLYRARLWRFKAQMQLFANGAEV